MQPVNRRAPSSRRCIARGRELFLCSAENGFGACRRRRVVCLDELPDIASECSRADRHPRSLRRSATTSFRGMDRECIVHRNRTSESIGSPLPNGTLKEVWSLYERPNLGRQEYEQQLRIVWNNSKRTFLVQPHWFAGLAANRPTARPNRWPLESTYAIRDDLRGSRSRSTNRRMPCDARFCSH
jgi:hypothetical protein